MRVSRSAVAVAACTVSYLALGHAIDSYFDEAVRPNSRTSKELGKPALVQSRAAPTAAMRSPADRIRDVFEQFPSSQRPTVKPRDHRGDGIMFALHEWARDTS